LAGGATAGLGLAGLALVGCGDDDDNSKTTATSPSGAGTTPSSSAGTAAPFKLTKDITLGFMSSFTGPLAPIYAPFANSAKTAIAEINESGGIAGVKISMIEADDASNPANVPAAALGLVDKKVNFCLGPVGSNAISASPALNQAKIVQFGYSDNGKLADPKQFPYSFRYVWSPEQSAKLIVDYYKKQGWEKIAILAENTVFGQTDTAATEAYMKSLNMKPTVSEFFPSGTSDFVALLKKAKDAGSQAIIWWTQGGPEGTSVLLSAESISFRMPIGGIGLFYPGGGKISPEILNQAFGFQWKRTTYTDSEKVPQKTIALRDAIKTRFGADSLGFTGIAVSPFYDMVYHLKAAIEGAKSVESDAVIKWLEKNPYDGVLAKYSAVTDKDHSVTDVDQITLGVIGSFDPANVPFQHRAPGL
jgi:branched-chain amino acid transport system substrate-binding protein